MKGVALSMRKAMGCTIPSMLLRSNIILRIDA